MFICCSSCSLSAFPSAGRTVLSTTEPTASVIMVLKVEKTDLCWNFSGLLSSFKDGLLRRVMNRSQRFCTLLYWQRRRNDKNISRWEVSPSQSRKKCFNKEYEDSKFLISSLDICCQLTYNTIALYSYDWIFNAVERYSREHWFGLGPCPSQPISEIISRHHLLFGASICQKLDQETN